MSGAVRMIIDVSPSPRGRSPLFFVTYFSAASSDWYWIRIFRAPSAFLTHTSFATFSPAKKRQITFEHFSCLFLVSSSAILRFDYFGWYYLPVFCTFIPRKNNFIELNLDLVFTETKQSFFGLFFGLLTSQEASGKKQKKTSCFHHL
jgi:hypothetical protein